VGAGREGDTFETDDGQKTLAELFDGRSQLLAHNTMFGPEYTGACPGCSNLADPGWMAFALEDDVVYHTYSRLAPDRDFVAPYYHQLLDRTPKGRVRRVSGHPPRRVRGIRTFLKPKPTERETWPSSSSG
jgi:predicted dithiol-disulfide oxidoreductase (DUF899 family)